MTGQVRDDGGNEPITAEVAARVKALRKAAGMSGTALAAALTERGVPWTAATVSKLETGGRASYTAQELVALGAVLTVPVGYLIEGTTERDRCVAGAQSCVLRALTCQHHDQDGEMNHG